MTNRKDKLLSEEKERINKKTTTPNILVYSFLLLLSVVVLIVALIAPISSKMVSVLSGVGCSGIVSVIVTWLVEITNFKHKETLITDFLNSLFCNHDNALKKELSTIVCNLAKNDPKIDIYKSFNITEVGNLLEPKDTLKQSLGILKSCYSVLGEECEIIEDGLLLSCDFSSRSIEAYSLLQSCKRNYSTFRELEEKLSDSDQNVLLIATLLLKTHLELIAQINEIRGNIVEIQLSAEEIKFIDSFRKAKKCNKC